MIRQLLIGGATAALVTGSASALTMNVSSDNRAILAEASAGEDFDSNSDFAVGSVFNSNVSASAQGNDVPFIQAIGSGGGGGFFGSVANASAGQNSEIGALSISVSGFVNASGNHGIDPRTISEADGSGGGGGGLFNSFQATGDSLLEVAFSIDATAKFDLSGFLNAGNELSDGPIGNDIVNSASVILINTDTSESVFKTEVNNGSTILDEMGEIGPGNYRFTAQAFASVDGSGNFSCIGCDEFTVAPIGVQGYSTSAGFKGVSLGLEAVDKPIPEPVTTTLAAMGLGALVLRTSRRRHS